MTLGLARTARQEMPIKLFTVEVDSNTPPSVATEAIAKLLLRINTGGLDPEHMNADYEFAISRGQILIPRLHWQTVSEAFARNQTNNTSTTKKSLCIQTPGLLHTLRWDTTELRRPGKGEVLVRANAAGLNFKVRTSFT